MDLSPVLAVPRPFLGDIHSCQIQHFQQAVIRWKYRFRFGNFPKLTVKALNSIGSINEPSDSFRILEISGESCPVVMP